MRRPDKHFAVRLAIATVAALVLGAPAAVLAVLVRGQWEPLLRLDLDVAHWWHDLATANPVLVRLWEFVSLAGGPTVFRVAGTLVGLWLIAERRPRVGLWALVTTWGGALLGFVLKLAVERARPELPNPVSDAPGWSFPSGHALTATVGCAVLLLVGLPVVRRKALAWTLAVVTVVLVALSRVGLGVHYVSDVTAGIVVGVAWVAATVAVFNAWRAEGGLGRSHPAVEGLEPERSEPGEHTAQHWLARELHAVAELVRQGRRLFFSWLALPVAGTLAGLLLVHLLSHSWVGETDTDLSEDLVSERTGLLNGVTAVMSGLAATPTIVGLTAVAAVALRLWRKRWRESIALILAVVGETSAFVLITLFVDRPRPAVPRLDEAPPTSSYPSGHTAAAVAFYATLAVILAWHTRHRWLPWVLGTAGVLVPAAVATGRLYRGMHFVTDVLSGALLGAVWMVLVVRFVLVDGLSADDRTPNPVSSSG